MSKFNWNIFHKVVHWFVKIYYTIFEKARKCPVGMTDCDTCPYRDECQFHMLENK